MTPQDLIAAFEKVAEAPKGVKRLRELVLQLAVRGKLVPQDPEDEPASVLLGQRALVAPDEAPFALPRGWAWTDLGSLGEIRGGGTPSKRNPAFWDGGVPWVSPKDMKRDLIGESILTVTEAAILGSSVKRIPAESLLMVVRGMILAHSFPTALTTADVTVNQDMKALLPFDVRLAPYLLVATKGSRNRVLDVVERSTHGTCKLPTTSLLTLPLAIPPLAEQHRIVARVDELMGLLDRLEAARDARDATRAAFRDAALAALADADTPEDVEIAWTRIAERMDDLFTGPEDVKPLRQTVLQLAVRGKLVPQDPEDEPASVLLERIAEEKARLVAEKKIRKPRPLEPLEDDDLPYTVPSRWSWAMTDDTSRPDRLTTYGILKPVWVDHGVPTVRITEMKTGSISIRALRKCSVERASKFEKTTLSEGEILITKDGTIGVTALVPPELVGGNITQHVLRLSVHPSLFNRYIRVAIDSPCAQSWMRGETKGVALQGVNVGDFRRMPLPVPPLPEQHRIVAKVDALRGLLDGLEERLRAAHDTQAAFAAAAVHHLDA